MASPAKIAEVLPDTLPEDFGEWDEEESPSTQPVRLASSEHGPGFGAVPKPTTQPAGPYGVVTASGNQLRGAASPASAREFVDDTAFHRRTRSVNPALDRSREAAVQRLEAAPAIDELRFSAPRPNRTPASAAHKAAPAPQTAAMTEADEILFQFFRANTAENAEPKPSKKGQPIIAGASAALVVILAAAIIPVFNHRKASSVKMVAAPAPRATVTQPPEDAARKPSLSTLTVPAPTQPAAVASDAQHTSDTAPALILKNSGPSRAQAQMMINQLYAPARIHTAAAPAEQAPWPSSDLAAANMDGSGNNNAIGSIFDSAKQPRVQIASPKVIKVSAGVAFGLQIQRTPPVYPPIAKTAQVSGTVVLEAFISKTGAIENLRVVSGPVMLRQSALDAVRTWRYRPYKLNNEPVEIETMINVIFSLAD